MKLSFNEFLEAVKGSKKVYPNPKVTLILPGRSELDTIQVYNYLELITKNFDPDMVKLLLNSINTYLHNLNYSFEYYGKFKVDAYKLDQFVELIYILENKLEKSKSIDHSGKNKITPKTFVDYLQNNDKAKLLAILHDIFVDAKPKDISKFILALIILQYIQIPYPRTKLYDAIRIEFYDFGTNQAMNIYLGDTISSNNKFSDKEIEGAKNLIENRLKG